MELCHPKRAKESCAGLECPGDGRPKKRELCEPDRQVLIFESPNFAHSVLN